jgi:hypothetical protein
VARSPGEAPEVNRGSVGQGGCGGGSPVRPVIDEGVAFCDRVGTWSPAVAVVGSSNAAEDKEA